MERGYKRLEIMSAIFYILDDEAKVLLLQRLAEAGYVCLSNRRTIAIFDSNENLMTTLHFSNDAPIELADCICFFYDYNLNLLNRVKIAKLTSQVERIMLDVGIKTYCGE